MEQIYSLEFLVLNFDNHSKLADEHLKFAIEKYKENFPDQDLPLSFSENFNISKSLSFICTEIQKIKTLLSKCNEKTHNRCM